MERKDGGNEVSIVLKDHTSNNGRIFQPNNLRLLKYEGIQLSNISTAERMYAFEYYGKLGKTITNWENPSAYNKMKWLGNKVKKLKKNWGKSILSAADSYRDAYTGKPGNAIADKEWWKNY